MATFPLANGFYIDEAVNLSNQECLNYIPAYIESAGALNPDALRAPAGLVTFSESAGEGTCRGAIRFRNELYTVHGGRFYHVADDGTKTAIGATVSGTNRVRMAENGVTISVIVPGTSDGYFFDFFLDTFVQITNPVFIDYGIKLDVCFNNGFFVYITALEFFLSSLSVENNGKDFNGLDFSTADASTDDNTACATIKDELYICGRNTLQVFTFTGDSFPYLPVPGATVDRGVLNAETLIEFQNRYLFIGAGANEGISIWEGLSGQSRRLSSPSIDNILQNLPATDLANAFSFKYSESGNFFCGFTVPNQITLVYDQTSSQVADRPIWHRRASSQTDTGVFRGSHVVQVYGEILVCDSIDGRIGEIDLAVFTEYGVNVLRRFNTVYVHNAGERFTVPELEIKSQVGISGVAVMAVSMPQIIFRLSDDGGVNFYEIDTQDLPTSPSSFVRNVFFKLGQFEYSLVMQFDVLTDQKITHTKLEGNVL